MNKKQEIKNRIDLINKGEVPEEYKKRFGYIVPNDWDIVPIKKVVTQVHRSVDKPNEPYYRLSVRSHAKGTFHSFVEDPETVAMEELYKVKENDLIVNITFAWEHAIAIVKKEDDGLLVSHRFPTYEFNKNACVKFYENIIKFPRIKKMLGDMSPGGAGRNRVLNQTDFYNKLYVPYASRKEQEKIAEILSCCDKVIELKEKLLNEKDKEKSYILNNLLQNFKKEKMVKLTDITYIITKGTTPSEFDINGEINYIKIESIFNNIINNDKCMHISKKINNKELARSVLNENDILFGIAGALGACAIVKNVNLPANTNQALAIIRINSNLADINFVGWIMCSKLMKKYIYLNNTGGAQANLNLKQISNFKLPLPALDKQIETARILDLINRKISLINKELEQYKQLKKSLSQLLLTGIVRVNEV